MTAARIRWKGALVLALVASPICAQDSVIQKQLLSRRQATDAFELQLRQSQEALRAPPESRSAIEARHLSERQRLDNLSNDQLRDVKPDTQTAPQLRSYELQKADREREPFRGPVVEVPATPAPKAAPIMPPQDGIRLEPAR